MNREEVISQIRKYKNRRLKTRLANYGSLTSVFLTLSIFSSGLSSSALVSFLIILPVPVYFLLQGYKLNKKSKAVHAHLKNLTKTISPTQLKFSLRAFLTQPNTAFRLTVILFFLVIFTTIARTKYPVEPQTQDQISYYVQSGK